MAEELFSHSATNVGVDHTVTRTIILGDDGAVTVLQRETRVVGQDVINDLEVLVRFTGEEWTAIVNAGFTPPAKRVISTREFIRRFTQAEKEAMEQLAEAATQNGRRMRIIFRELDGDLTVNLDHQSVIDALNLFLKPVFVAQGVWASNAAADVRITAIRA